MTDKPIRGSQQLHAVTVGELLVDFVPRARSPWVFDARPGGAPANVAAALAQHGRRVGLVTSVGLDALGNYARDALARAGVDLSLVQQDTHRPTPVTVIQPEASDGERYVLYRRGATDGALSLDELATNAIASAHILHVGTLSLSTPKSREATLAAIEIAHGHGRVVSVDLNLRRPAWPSTESMVEAACDVAQAADVVKLTRDELRLLEAATGRLPTRKDTIVLVTDAGEPAVLMGRGVQLEIQPPPAAVVDVSGAGDAFMAGFLHGVLPDAQHPNSVRFDRRSLERALAFAVRCGSAAVESVGAMSTEPVRHFEEI